MSLSFFVPLTGNLYFKLSLTTLLNFSQLFSYLTFSFVFYLLGSYQNVCKSIYSQGESLTPYNQ